MKIGFAVPTMGAWATPANQVAVARRAERLGYHSLWTLQRLLTTEATPAYRNAADPVVTLAYLAGQTSRVRLGVAVLNMPFFSPALLAKQTATLDQVSGGRLDLGLGLGWQIEEYAASGVPYQQRGKRAEEYLKVLRALWTQDVAHFDGEFYRVPPARLEPKPIQRPHPPLLLGGSAERALKRAGRLADGWVSSSTADLTRIGEAIEVVRAAAREAGRDPATLRFVCRGVVRVGEPGGEERRPLTGSLEQIRQDLPVLAAQGVTELFYDLNFDPRVAAIDADPAASLRYAEEVMEALAP